MQVTKEQAYIKIQALVERFSEHVDEYKRNNYNEHQTRVDYINPFFKALGWDVDNEQGFAEAYREVIHEDKIKVGSATKAPDYGFTLFGQRKFFVDAKKPSVNIKSDLAPAYQVRRYGWSAKVPISIVTDFEEFSIYDCTKKPKPTDKASVARIKYLTYDRYLDEFDFLWDVFAKENLPKGRFDKYVQSDTRKKGTATVDDEFLKSIEEWRKYLATTIALRNKQLNEDEVNFAVQKTIDRIIFLRMCEDRGIEQYGELKKAAAGGDVYKNLFALFATAHDKYNSGLFDFGKDRITPGLVIDNKVLKTITKELYYPHSEYEFSVMPADILGSVYERFLGKTIRLTKAHHAKVEEKPEVRKAGGVYYTPKYVVDYIVQNTVGKLLEGKTPVQVEKIKICDPACGSGSFLIGAYQYLLEWHLKYYMKNPPRKRKNNPLTPDGNLTTAEKKRILLNNIYGVDIDAQAVEVTKLNLLLKALEGETKSSISQQLSLFHERVLPDLDNNIKCGNSLIGTDFYDTHQFSLPFGEGRGGVMKKINAFDWEEGFQEVFEKGGFDAVIGNPPYVRIQVISESHSHQAVEYLKSTYNAGKTGNFDLYVIFTEAAYNLLNKNGILGFIQPHKFFQSKFGMGLRDFLSERKALRQIVYFGAQQVFQGATTYTCLLFLTRESNRSLRYHIVNDITEWSIDTSKSEIFESNQPKAGLKWYFVSKNQQIILDRLNKQPFTLERITRKIFTGLQTSADSIYVLELIEDNRDNYLCFSKILEEKIEIEKGLLKPFLLGRDIKRYKKPIPKHLVLFPYQIKEGKAILMSQAYLKKSYPLGWEYISRNKKSLENRENGRMKGGNYYAYIYPKNLIEFEVQKILMPHTGLFPEFTFDSARNYHTTNGYSIVFNDNITEDNKYFLGILNSRLTYFYMKLLAPVLRGGYINFKPIYIGPFPIKLINFTSNAEKISYDQIVNLVNNLLNLNAQLQTTQLETHRQQIQRAIAHAEKKIDELVYALYGLTEEEIRIVEGGEG